MEKKYDADPSNYAYIWFAMHVFALALKTARDKKCYKNFITVISEKLPCKKCRKHLKQYMEDMPIENYYRRKNGCFRWSWELHNKVNEFLGKPIVKYQDALTYYTYMTSHDCGSPSCD